MLWVPILGPKSAILGVFFACPHADQWLRVYSCRGSSLRALRCSRGRDVGWAILDVVFSPDASQCLYSSWSDYGGRGFEEGAGLRGGGGALRGRGFKGKELQ